MAFAEAAIGTDTAALDAARARVVEELGPEGLCDTAAIAALFNAIDRVADSTGIPLEEEKASLTETMREQLGINSFGRHGMEGMGQAAE